MRDSESLRQWAVRIGGDGLRSLEQRLPRGGRRAMVWAKALMGREGYWFVLREFAYGETFERWERKADRHAAERAPEQLFASTPVGPTKHEVLSAFIKHEAGRDDQPDHFAEARNMVPEPAGALPAEEPVVEFPDDEIPF